MTTTPTPRTNSTSAQVSSLKAHRGIRYAGTGAVLLMLALTHVITTLNTSTDFGANQLVQLGMAAIGTALVITGIVKAARR